MHPLRSSAFTPPALRMFKRNTPNSGEASEEARHHSSKNSSLNPAATGQRRKCE